MLAQLRFSPAVRVSGTESLQELQQPDPETVEQAFELFSTEGYLVLPEIFPPSSSTSCTAAFWPPTAATAPTSTTLMPCWWAIDG